MKEIRYIKIPVKQSDFSFLVSLRGSRQWWKWFNDDVLPILKAQNSKGKTPYKPSDEEMEKRLEEEAREESEYRFKNDV